MRQSCKLCYELWMKLYRWNSSRAVYAVVLMLATASGPVIAQTPPSTEAPKTAAPEPKSKTQKLESIEEHFEKVKDPRGFPMNLLPEDTTAGLVWTALGVGVVSSLLIVSGGSIAIVNYESQSQPAVLPQDRLSARAAGRVGLGIAAAGIAAMFIPPLLIDLALPQPEVPMPRKEAPMVADPEMIKEVTSSQTKDKKASPGAPSSTAPSVKVKKQQ